MTQGNRIRSIESFPAYWMERRANNSDIWFKQKKLAKKFSLLKTHNESRANGQKVGETKELREKEVEWVNVTSWTEKFYSRGSGRLAEHWTGLSGERFNFEHTRKDKKIKRRNAELIEWKKDGEIRVLLFSGLFLLSAFFGWEGHQITLHFSDKGDNAGRER